MGRYYVRIGDMLCNLDSGAIAIVTKITSSYVHFHLLSSVNTGSFLAWSHEKARKKEIYYHIDKNEIQIYYGSMARRRKRAIVVDYI